jgi:hypothetical protein
MKNTSLNFTFAAVLLLSLCALNLALQKPGGREPSTPPSQEPKRQKTAIRGHSGQSRAVANSTHSGVKPPSEPAGLSLNVTPGDSTIVFDGKEYHAENGTFVRRGLKAGNYKVAVRRDGYSYKENEITLEAGRVASLSISLEVLRGTLFVNPGVAHAQVSILAVETNEIVGNYIGRVNDLKLLPGRYKIFASEEGYKTAIQEVTVNFSQVIILSMPLEPLPKQSSTLPAPTRRTVQEPFRPDPEMQVQTSVEGKFVVVALNGRSGNTSSAVGAVDVTLTRNGQMWSANVSGMITGHPCQIDFVRLENVADYSFAEPPGVGNEWARAVLRIRPKDNNRPIRFLINWKAL